MRARALIEQQRLRHGFEHLGDFGGEHFAQILRRKAALVAREASLDRMRAAMATPRSALISTSSSSSRVSSSSFRRVSTEARLSPSAEELRESPCGAGRTNSASAQRTGAKPLTDPRPPSPAGRAPPACPFSRVPGGLSSGGVAPGAVAGPAGGSYRYQTIQPGISGAENFSHASGAERAFNDGTGPEKCPGQNGNPHGTVGPRLPR